MCNQTDLQRSHLCLPKPYLRYPLRLKRRCSLSLRRVRYGYFLSLHILLLCARGKSPTEIAEFCCCSRSSVYRTVEAYQKGKFQLAGATAMGEEQTSAARVALSSLSRSLLSIVKCVPHSLGWCRTRWSCATLALELKARRGVRVSRETIRRSLHELGYEWKRARHAARDDDPERETKLARIRYIFEHLGPSELLFFVDELDIHLLPKLGYEWMRRGTQREVMTPGKNEKRYVAGALSLVTGKVLSVVGEKKNRFLFLDLLKVVDAACAVGKVKKIYLVADNYRIHKAKVVTEWLRAHPRFEILWLPRYCPKANPIERVYGDLHDNCTRNHRRKRMRELVADVIWHFKVNGPWRYRLSEIYYTAEVTKAVAEMERAAGVKAA